jgi:hypothetical protein
MNEFQAIVIRLLVIVVMLIFGVFIPAIFRIVQTWWQYKNLHKKSYLEVINRKECELSIGRFEYTWDGHLVYSGRNFDENANIVERWDSVVLRIHGKTIYYVYSSDKDAEPHIKTHGFGTIKFSEDKLGRPIPRNGYFRSAADNDSSVSMIQIIPIADVESRVQYKLNDLSDKSAIAFIKHCRNFINNGQSICG